MFDLSGRIALVTGASSGFGARFAKLLSRAGAKVVVGARRVDRLEALTAEMRSEGGDVIAAPLDVANEASIVAAYDLAERTWGVVDTVVANAGVSWTGRATDMPAEAFDDVMAINARAVFLTAREGARRLIASGSHERGNGRIVLISSITGQRPEAGLVAYSASKAAVIAMTKALALEWIRRGINVNAICPGYAKTEINDAWFDSPEGAKQIAQFHRRRLMEESDLDATLLLLCSDASRGITGTAITVDDGQSL